MSVVGSSLWWCCSNSCCNIRWRQHVYSLTVVNCILTWAGHDNFTAHLWRQLNIATLCVVLANITVINDTQRFQYIQPAHWSVNTNVDRTLGLSIRQCPACRQVKHAPHNCLPVSTSRRPVQSLRPLSFLLYMQRLKRWLHYVQWSPVSQKQVRVCQLHSVSEKNVPTLTSCSFNKHGLMLTIFTVRHVCIAQTMPWQDVRPSVCPSVTCQYLPKRLHISSKFFHCRAAPPF